MKLIVGLGNPGSEYSETRHNLGFKVADELAKRHRVKLKNSTKRKALTAKISKLGDGVLLAEPTTFMNLSGWAVQALVSFHKIAVPDMLVMVDDADLPLGKIRIRKGGSAGGHNGLKSIIQELGTEFPRLRIGVGRQPGELKSHVLGHFGTHERLQIEQAVKKAADAAEMFATDGIVKVMNTFNSSEPNQSTEDQA